MCLEAIRDSVQRPLQSVPAQQAGHGDHQDHKQRHDGPVCDKGGFGRFGNIHMHYLLLEAMIASELSKVNNKLSNVENL